MRGNKRTWPNFHFCFYDLREFKFFSPQNPGEKMTWLLPLFKWRGVLKIFEFHLKIFPILKLCATQWFSREKIKWLLQNIWNMSWEFQRNSNLKSILKLFSILELFEFYSNYFSPKIKYMEIRVKWFPTSENWRKINLKSFWYF